VCGDERNLIKSFELDASSDNVNNADIANDENYNNNNPVRHFYHNNNHNNHHYHNTTENDDNLNKLGGGGSLDDVQINEGRLDNLKHRLENDTMKKILDIAHQANTLVAKNEKIIMDQNAEILHLKRVIKDNLFIQRQHKTYASSDDEVTFMMKDKELFSLKKQLEENEIEREEFRQRIEELYVQIYEAEEENKTMRTKLESEALLRAELSENLEKALQDNEQLQIEKTKTHTAFLNEKMQMYEVQKTLASQLERVNNENDELKAKINGNDPPRKGSGKFSFF